MRAENCSYILIFHDYAILCPERIKELFALRKKEAEQEEFERNEKEFDFRADVEATDI